MKVIRKKEFANGVVYALETADGYPIETTDTFLPFYTKDAVGRKQNALTGADLGSRKERWMIGVSVMSGCPVGCKFCATGQLPRWRNLTTDEILAQVSMVVTKNAWQNCFPCDAKEFKINYTRMGEPFLNIDCVRGAIACIEETWPGTHHYVSTIGVKGSDFSWMTGNITLQISLHSLDSARRDELIPFTKKMSLTELGEVRVDTRLKPTLNLTLVDDKDFDIEKLKQLFDPDKFFIKLSPINPNPVSAANGCGAGIIEAANLV